MNDPDFWLFIGMFCQFAYIVLIDYEVRQLRKRIADDDNRTP